MRCYAVTHRGLVRPGNEDSFLIPEAGESFAAVCDGMGGHLAGEVASRIAVDSLRDSLSGAAPGQEMLRAAIRTANRDVYRRAQDDAACAGMGTTLTALWWTEDRVLMGHVGDSRLYRFDGARLSQLTHDHTYVQGLVDLGEITARQARVHPRRNLITRAVGTDADVEVDTAAFDREPGMVYLLCSDGLTNMLEDAEIAAILGRGTPDEQLKRLLDGALERGGTDNITAVLVVDGEGGT